MLYFYGGYSQVPSGSSLGGWLARAFVYWWGRLLEAVEWGTAPVLFLGEVA